MQTFSHQVSLTAFYKVSIMDANNGNKKTKENKKKNKIKTKIEAMTKVAPSRSFEF